MNKNDRSAEPNRPANSHGEQPAARPEPEMGAASGPGTECSEDTCRTDLAEEYVTAQKKPVQEGEVRIHKAVDSELQHFAVDTSHDEVYVEHLPINQEVSRRQAPWQEDDAIIVPVYEEQVVVTRRLVLKEKLRIRRVTTTERQDLTEEVRRERPVVEELGRHGTVHERYPAVPPPNSTTP